MRAGPLADARIAAGPAARLSHLAARLSQLYGLLRFVLKMEKESKSLPERRFGWGEAGAQALGAPFGFTSCDGIDAADSAELFLGHAHWNLGFSEAGQ